MRRGFARLTVKLPAEKMKQIIQYEQIASHLGAHLLISGHVAEAGKAYFRSTATKYVVVERNFVFVISATGPEIGM